MSDLASLFPDLPPEVLRDFDAAANSFQSNAPLSIGGEQAQVTDDQIADYLRSVGSLRAPLNPAVSGQRTPPVPEFVNNGRAAPSADLSYVEAPDLGDAAGEAAPPSTPPPGAPPSPPRQPPLATETTPLPVSPPPPSGPPDLPPPPYTAPPGEEVPPPPPAATRSEGIEALVQLWDGDPELRNLVAGYLTTGRPPATIQPQGAPPPPPPSPVAGVPPQYQQQYYPPTPPVQPQYGLQQPPYAPVQPQYAPQDEFTDPNLRALYEQNAALQDRLSRLESQQQYSSEQYNQQQLRHYEQVVEGAVSRFGSDYALPPNVLQSVRETAARIGAANTYMNGTHPITGLPVRPDPNEAVKTALSIAYYATPVAQELERQRTVQRAQQDMTRRQRLSGVGGSSASVPRQPPQPTNAQDRRTAMNDEVREMFNGTWTGGNNN